MISSIIDVEVKETRWAPKNEVYLALLKTAVAGCLFWAYRRPLGLIPETRIEEPCVWMTATKRG